MYCEDCDREGVTVDSVRDCARCAAIKARGSYDSGGSSSDSGGGGGGE